MTQKESESLDTEQQKELGRFYERIVFRPGNFLRVLYTKDHLRAIALEKTLIRFYNRLGQCEYNYDIE